MPRVAVVHADVNAGGGAEAVCAHALEALAPGWDVTLITWRPPDFGQLDRLYGTALSGARIAVRCVGERGHPSWLAWRAVYQHAMAARLAQDTRDDYDAVVSTYCEIAARPPALQYIHVPHYSARVPSALIVGVARGPLGSAVRRASRVGWRVLARGSRRAYARNVSLANSRWTAGWLRRAWGIEAAVLWPPLPAAAPAPEVPWERRENGFVCVGKLSPGKRVLEMIDAVGALRGRGVEAHLHVVGGGEGPYADAVRERCRRSGFAVFEGLLGVDDLAALIGEHRYGLHGFAWEHFGIGVAQMVRAGCLCFAPRGGGQQELLGDSPALLYATFAEAVGLMEKVLCDPALQQGERDRLAPIRARLAAHRFGPAFASHVEAALRGAPGSTKPPAAEARGFHTRTA